MMLRFRLWIACLSVMVSTCVLSAEKDIYIPESLEPWVDWVLEKNPHISCPVRATDGARLNCIWVRETSINVVRGETFGATFELKVEAFAESSLQLPYNGSFKPQNFTLNGEPVALGGGNSAPEVLVPVGSHLLKGELVWTEEAEPRFLEIPRSGIVRLTINGVNIEHPALQDSGSKLWFSNEISDSPTTTSAPDTEVVRVFRHFVDDVPQTLTTHIRVTITGNPRILEFGRVLTDEYEITNLASRWPAILSKEGNLVVQVTPGTNEIQIHARATEQLNSFKFHKASSLWPNVEYWGIQPQHDLRVIRLEGGQRTNLSQINAPRQMHQLSGFVLTTDDELKIIEEQRGSTQTYSSSFDISRDIWLNFRGDSFTVSDSIETNVSTSQRVTSTIPLGEVRINGSPRLITYDDSSGQWLSSIFLNSIDRHIESVSNVERAEPLVSNPWSVETESLNTWLHLPPGWMLLWSQGVDEVEHSWLSKWGIWDVFVVLLLLCLVWGLGGWKWTAVVAGTVILSYQLDQAPTIGWILLAGMCYAVKAINLDKLNRITTVGYWIVFAGVALACVFHSSISARNALHPQLAAQSPTFAQQVANTLVSRYTADEIERLGVSDISDFFRRTVSQFNSTSPTASTSSTFSDIRGTEQEEIVSTGSRISDSAKEELSDIYSSLFEQNSSRTLIRGRQTQVDFDPTLPIAIQTGPGRPEWAWQTIALSWHGPVAQNQKMSLVLLSPWMTRLFYGLSGVSTLLVLFYFLSLKVPGVKNWIGRILPSASSVSVLAFVGFMCTPQDTHADIPDADLLGELERRLLAPQDCLDECAYLEEAKLILTDNELKIAMRIHAEDRVAISLPTEESTWNLIDVRRGSTQLPLLRERSRLYTLLNKGVHDVVMTASVKGLNQLDLEFDLIPGNLEIDAPNWRVEGLIRGQVDDRNLTFSRVNRVNDDGSAPTSTTLLHSNFDQLEITPYVTVIRQIVLSYEPTILTRVTRRAPFTEEITVRIPLLPNELVTTREFSVEDEHMVVNLKASQQSIAWESKLDVDSSITLSAPSIADRSERWTVSGSDFWSFDYEGIDPIDTRGGQTSFVPLSNEILDVVIQQTQPVPGESITVSRVNTSHTVDLETTTTTLDMTILASQPGDVIVSLPEDASVESIYFDGDFQSLPTSNEVLLPVQSGNDLYSLKWTTENGASVVYRPLLTTINQRAANASTSIQLPDNRWILWLAGPSLGSTVTYWSILVGALLLATVVSRIPGIAVSTQDAVILTIGATLVHLSVLVFAGIWFISIWFKSRFNDEINRRWLYRVGQILQCVITLVVLIVVVRTIVTALTNDPNMYITGYQTTYNQLHWFVDETAGTVPTPWVLSLPIWIYFALILVWSMWLVFSVLKWIRVWWQTLKTPVLWIPINVKSLFEKLVSPRRKQPSLTESIDHSD